MTVTLEPLDNVLAQLARSVERYARESSDDMIRDSVIQRFEFSYDLAHKMLHRVLEATMSNVEEVSQMTFPTLIRTGWEQGLVPGGWPLWEGFRKLRNTTSHTYDESQAISAVEQIPAFLDEARTVARLLAARLEQ